MSGPLKEPGSSAGLLQQDLAPSSPHTWVTIQDSNTVTDLEPEYEEEINVTVVDIEEIKVTEVDVEEINVTDVNIEEWNQICLDP